MVCEESIKKTSKDRTDRQLCSLDTDHERYYQSFWVVMYEDKKGMRSKSEKTDKREALLLTIAALTGNIV